MGAFGQRLRDLRNSRGISQNELSKHIGVSKSSVNMYERGEREPSFETLEAIADYFNVNIDYLMGRGAVKYTDASITPNQVNLAVRIDEKLFSAKAQPKLVQFVAAVNSAFQGDSEAIERGQEVISDFINTCSTNDITLLVKMLSDVSDMCELFLTPASAAESPQSSPAPQENITTPAQDGSETPPESK